MKFSRIVFSTLVIFAGWVPGVQAAPVIACVYTLNGEVYHADIGGCDSTYCGNVLGMSFCKKTACVSKNRSDCVKGDPQALGIQSGMDKPEAGVPGFGVPAMTPRHDFSELPHLLYLYGQEKMARDVYASFSQWYPQVIEFKEGVAAEQILHGLFAGYANKSNTADSVGLFTDDDFGRFYAEQYSTLTGQGRISEFSALYAAAKLEEMIIRDIYRCPELVLNLGTGSKIQWCGLSGNNGVLSLMLMHGAKKRLRALIQRIEDTTGEGGYVGQYLEQDEVARIVSHP